MKQVLPKIPSANLFDYHGMKIVLNQSTLEEGTGCAAGGGGSGWTDLECQTSSILEVSLPQGTWSRNSTFTNIRLFSNVMSEEI